ncbi:MAG: hypothetical protein ABSA83_07165 [Verrucomicrobiota bacterium]
MKIIVTPAGGTGFVLGDDTVSLVVGVNFSAGAGGQIKEGFVNKQKRRVQHSPLFRAAYLLNIARLNWENRFAFTVQRSFQTLEACVAFIAFHPDSVPAAGEITLSNQSGTGVVLRYLPAAVIEMAQCTRQIGLSCDFQYTIAGNGPWQTSP